MANGEVMVEISNLHKSFDGNLVLDGVSFNVAEAENMVVFGRSGTGKSVLLKCMIRLMEPDSGDVSTTVVAPSCGATTGAPPLLPSGRNGSR